MGNVVEVRFDCEPHEISEAQVDALLKTHDKNLDIDVGLGYENMGAATFSTEAAEHVARNLGESVANTARGAGLSVLDIVILTDDEYEARAWSEFEEDEPDG
jgi:hypothetical protein